MNLLISVIVCTHNPRSDYFDRVISALTSQTLPTHAWELLLIDNLSDHPLDMRVDLSWHPNARCIRENQLGLTSARLRGIRESVADLLIFVDDDNVLEHNYLDVALKISQGYPIIGAWGGRILPEFEEVPPEWSRPYWRMLAIRDFDQDKWSNLLHQHETTPCGAGLCVRRIVAERYVELVTSNPQRAGMDRKGKRLTSCGDSDLAFTACDIGMGTGQFVSLKLIHLMPASRLTEEYLLRLAEGTSYSLTILEFLRGAVPAKLSWRSKLFHQYQRWRMGTIQKRFVDASNKGIKLALDEIHRLQP